MNYWQFKISNKAWKSNDSEEYNSLKEKDYIYIQQKVQKHKMNHCTGDIVFHYNNVKTNEFSKGIYLISEIISDVFERNGDSCINLKVLKDLRSNPYDYEIDFKKIHEYYNTTNIRGRAQTYEKIDIKFSPNNLYKMVIYENNIDLELNILDSLELDITEVQSIISIRKGQEKFRQKLINNWQGCAVTGCKMINILVASHIKPWKISDDKERLDVYNGLLLLPNLDKLFDRGYISFQDNGQIIISDMIENYEELGINQEMEIELEKNHKPYLQYHRENVFIK